MGCPTLGETKCDKNAVLTCTQLPSGGQDWQTSQFCAVDTQQCKQINGSAQCVDLPTCKDGIRNQDETDIDCGGSTCAPCASGDSCTNDSDCASDACDAGVCQICKAGSFACHGNHLDQCKPTQDGWDNVKVCNALGGQVCDPNAGTCSAVKVIGNGPNNPTGTYYQYAHLTPSNSVFKGGGDVDSRGDLIYVNRDGSHVDVYQVSVEDTDGDGVIEPNQHPDNPKATGVIEKRNLKYIKTYDVPIGAKHSDELYITDHDTIMFVRAHNSGYYGDIWEYDMKTGQTTKIVDTNGGFMDQVLGYDPLSQRWYSVSPHNRWVFSYGKNDPAPASWVLEFAYPNMAGSHNDGMEVVVDPNTGVPYVYVSDMTSNFIGQYVKENGVWKQKNLFQYNNNTGDDVEGMGFGALNHFWITNDGYGSGVQVLYELGGGELQQYIEPS